MRFKTIKNVFEKEFDVLPLEGVFRSAFGQPESGGMWLIYGMEKHGKTTFSLLLANELSKHKRTAYIMAEQGFDKDFQDTIRRLALTSPPNSPQKGGLQSHANLLFEEYVPLKDLSAQLKKRKQPDVIFIDNITIYNEELKRGALRKLILDHPKKLFIMLAHEDKGEVYTATGKLARRLAKRVVHVEGMRATVEGRGGGSELVIDDRKAALYHGSSATLTDR